MNWFNRNPKSTHEEYKRKWEKEQKKERLFIQSTR